MLCLQEGMRVCSNFIDFINYIRVQSVPLHVPICMFLRFARASKATPQHLTCPRPLSITCHQTYAYSPPCDASFSCLLSQVSHVVNEAVGKNHRILTPALQESVVNSLH